MAYADARSQTEAGDEVYDLPHARSLDGLNLITTDYQVLFEKRLDDYRLTEGDDVLISAYPRTGTTWLNQILSLLLAKEETYEQHKEIIVFKRVLYLEFTDDGIPRVERLHTVPTPRAVKTHLPYRFIHRWIDEDNLKTIIITRNPKDTLVSLYHFYRAKQTFVFNGSWIDFFRHFQARKVVYGDQYEWYKDWNDNKDKGQLMFIKYEHMKQDAMAQITRIVAFLGLEVSDKHKQRVVQDSGFVEMEKDLGGQIADFTTGSLVRKGVCGEWKKYFTVEQNEWFDNKYKKLYEELDIDVDYN